MKKFYFIMFFIASFMMNSCTALAQVYYEDDYVYSSDEHVTYMHVIKFGEPYYINNVLSYYIYKNVYYYPYIWEGHHYLRPYKYAQPRGFVYRPERGHRPERYFRGPNERQHNYRMQQHRDVRRERGIVNNSSRSHINEIPRATTPQRVNSSTRSINTQRGHSTRGSR